MLLNCVIRKKIEVNFLILVWFVFNMILFWICNFFKMVVFLKLIIVKDIVGLKFVIEWGICVLVWREMEVFL